MTICDVKRPLLPGSVKSSEKAVSSSSKSKKRLLVYYIGGITYAEISALRFINSQRNCPYEIIIAATSIIDGKQLLKSFVHQFKDRF